MAESDTQPGLFTEDSQLPDGHPLKDTHLDVPAGEVAKMTATQREQRVEELVGQAHALVDYATATLLGGKELVAACSLFSGGNDSTVLTHLMRDRVDYAIHANTGIGIEQTRTFVRKVCRDLRLPLLEETPPVSYRDLVIERGFPGPAMHFKMYTRLKERCIYQAKRKLVTNGRKQRIMFLAGRRRAESRRRAAVPEMERRGAIIWVSPLVLWTALDMNTYRLGWAKSDLRVPVNEVSSLIHMSGECLCGAFAKKGELEEIGQWFPDVADEIRALEREVTAAGHPPQLCKWGWGPYQKDFEKVARAAKSGPMCTTCDASLFDHLESSNDE